MKPTPRIIKAIDPQDLKNQVAQSLAANEDLYAPLFVSAEGLLCQRVVCSTCIFEYHLIVADDLDRLELEEQNLTYLGFDYAFSTVMWNGKYLQWMQKLNDAGVTVRDAVMRLSAERAADLFVAAERGDELRLVEDVRAELGMEPTRDSAPFPLSIRLS